MTNGTAGAADTSEAVGTPMRLRAAGWTLLAVSVVLNVASLAVPALVHHPLTRDRGEIRMYLDVFGEGNLPTWWSTGLLVAGALLHAVTAVVARARARAEAWAWWGSAALLAALSLDDHTQLHERLDRIGRRFVTFDGFPHYWLVPGLILGAIVAAALFLLASRLQGTPRWCVVAGCGLLLGSALGMETLQGLLFAGGESGPVYALTYHVEELGENLGVLLLLAAAARSLSITRREGGVTFEYRARSVPGHRS